jgi:hypothetical protein
MNQGGVSETMTIAKAITRYLLRPAKDNEDRPYVVNRNSGVSNITAICTQQGGVRSNTLRHDDSIEVIFDVAAGQSPTPTTMSIAICDKFERKVFTAITPALDRRSMPFSTLRFKMTIRRRFLMPGEYSIIAGLLDQNLIILDLHRFVCPFQVTNAGDETLLSAGADCGVVFGEYTWEALNN